MGPNRWPASSSKGFMEASPLTVAEKILERKEEESMEVWSGF